MLLPNLSSMTLPPKEFFPVFTYQRTEDECKMAQIFRNYFPAQTIS
jgi:hypothetical protein